MKYMYLLSFPTTSKNPTSGETSLRNFPCAACLVYATSLNLSLYVKCIAFPVFSEINHHKLKTHRLPFQTLRRI